MTAVPPARASLTVGRYTALAAGYVAVYAIGGWALSGQAVARAAFGSVALMLPAAALVVVILRRRRQWLGCQRLFWDGLATGAVLWLVGYSGRIADLLSNGSVEWLGWHTAFSLSGTVAPAIALMARPHLGVRASSAGAVAIVVASYGLLAAFVYAYFLFIPAFLTGFTGWPPALVILGQGARFVLVAGALAAAWAAKTSGWKDTYLALAAGGAAGLLLRGLTAATSDSATAAGTLSATAWLVPFLAFVWAAIDAPASPGREVVEAPGCPPLLCAVPAFLMPLIGYAVPTFYSLGTTGDSLRSLLTGVMSIGGLGLLTLRLSAQTGALQRADGRWRLLAAAIEQSGDAIVITRADGTFEHANDAFLRSVGYTREDLARLTAADLADRGSEVVSEQMFRDVERHGMWRGTVVRRRGDGSAFHSACTVIGVPGPTGRISHLVAVERDITEELHLRDQLVHAERLSAMGALIAGIAHEINNPLQSILGSAEVVLEEERAPTARRELEVVRHEAGRAAQIVRSLLAFARRPTVERTPGDLNDVVRSALALRQYHLERTPIALAVTLTDAPLPVVANHGEIQQVVLNLILNAESAIESDGGSVISVRTSLIGGSCCVEIADDGPGISKDLRGRIFEPFFTTKEVGKGTGLGLSISHGIAFAHGGSLELYGDPPRGACFRLMLPTESPALQLSDVPPAYSTSSSRIALIVDDEMPIRRLLAHLLERRGYAVMEADSGDAALMLVAQRMPAVIVCDIRMPGMNGIDLFARICAARPDCRARFVFMSGDSAQARAEGLADDVPILKKPFSSADLDAALQQAAP